MIKHKIVGKYWTQTTETDNSWKALIETDTGVIIAASADDRGLWYSEDNGITWVQSNITTGSFSWLCCLYNNRIFAYKGSSDNYCSDDNGKTWHASALTSYAIKISNGLLLTREGRLSNDNGDTQCDFNSGGTSSYCDIFRLEDGRILQQLGKWSANEGVNFDRGFSSVKVIINANCNNDTTFTTTVKKYVHSPFTHKVIALTSTAIASSDPTDLYTWQKLYHRTGSDYLSDVCIPNENTLLISTTSKVLYSTNNGYTWTISEAPAKAWTSLCVTKSGRVLACCDTGIYYSDPVNIQASIYSSLPVTGTQAKEYVRQFKAYVQSLKS
jgi:hypothetical protein